MIDIIIPAYNAHKYIEKALISISMQTISNQVNVYIINDCSKKDYSEIIKIFKDRIKIKEIKLEKNSGPGVARQIGIEKSKNEYILFLDSDDLLYNIFSLEKLYKTIISNKADICIGGILDEDDNNLNYYNNHMGCLHGKLYRRKIIEKNNLKFNNSRSSEDNSFNRLFLMSNPKITYLDECVYLYRDNKKSQSKKYTGAKYIKDYIYNMEWAVEQAEQKKYDKYQIAELIFSTISYIYSIYVNNQELEEINVIFDMSKNLIKLYDKYKGILSNEDYKFLYDEFEKINIPKISLYEFIKLCR